MYQEIQVNASLKPLEFKKKECLPSQNPVVNSKEEKKDYDKSDKLHELNAKRSY